MRALLLAIAFLVVAACGGEVERERGVVEVRTGEAVVEFEVEVAATDEARRRGLMGRESLPPRGGMLFLFPKERRGGFWMKNTPLPLSIAFLDAQGRILTILDMDPCRTDPCPVYDPGHPYRAALEVNQGAFERLGVEVGDVATLSERGDAIEDSQGS